MKYRSVAIFDFDGTITFKDTLSSFIRFTKGKKRYYFGLMVLSPLAMFFFLGIISRQTMKEAVLIYFFRSIPVEVFDKKAHQFATRKIPELLRKKAIKCIDLHRANGDRVVVVSASPENWVKKWAIMNGCEAIATRLQVRDGRISGKISGKNCQGPEKVIRIKSLLNLEDYETIYTYGDTPGDLHFLRLGHLIFYKPFRSNSICAIPKHESQI